MRTRGSEPLISQIIGFRRWGFGVCGEFSIGVGFEPDVNEGFDEKAVCDLSEIVGEDGRDEADGGDAIKSIQWARTKSESCYRRSIPTQPYHSFYSIRLSVHKYHLSLV